ncbi:MAG: trehalose-6-phosphate synthase [Pseudomonadota bacterium]
MGETGVDYILASKRAAVTFTRDAQTGALCPDMAPGGTANVVADLSERLNTSWIASAMTQEDIEVARANPEGLELEYNATNYARPICMRLLEHDPTVFDHMQTILTADLIWHSHNTLWDSWTAPNFDDDVEKAWDSFHVFSQQVADAVSAELAVRKTGRVLLHDYQLSLVPAKLRAAGCTSPLLLFIHIPWPEPDYWRMMPKYIRTEMLTGMLGADSIAFFCNRWCVNFIRCVKDLIPEAHADEERMTVTYDGQTTRLENMPLGYSQQALDAREGEFPPEIAEWLGGAPFMIHSGRTDPMKNAHRAIKAYQMAALRDPVVRRHKMLVRMNPNRLYVADNAAYRDLVYRAADEANTVLGTEAVRVVCENNVRATIGCLERADMVLVNSTIDGQNLTVFEAALTNENDAPIILSERTGAAEVMASVCDVINPFDMSELCDVIVRNAHATADVRCHKAVKRREVAARYGLDAWVDMQVRSLEHVDSVHTVA